MEEVPQLSRYKLLVENKFELTQFQLLSILKQSISSQQYDKLF